ncbi:unnamed protein product [Kuraishia capsulata CBS 1993]|uniref:Uncharacterized protein n=1 Tax=Kuraishia capsulata CBS 1993 TaxID=1382522 RepID=W6MXC2_9ASCO|nr:uncharacterized protein KUCA_T00004619001 [Kuraishia capsulata CBS 1993]CDK28635.1 unnamed protein product [Kuraishia capsulata CBS 1993]
MAPKRAFLRVSAHKVIPVRVFINHQAIRQASENAATAAIPAVTHNKNRKVLVRLRRAPKKIKIRERELSLMLEQLKGDILKYVLDTSLENLLIISTARDIAESASKGKYQISIPLEQNGWKCVLVMTSETVQQIRDALDPLILGSKKLSGLLIKEDIWSADKEAGATQILEEEGETRGGGIGEALTGEVQILQEEEEGEENGNLRDIPAKKQMTAKYHHLQILGHSIDVHVHGRPERRVKA